MCGILDLPRFGGHQESAKLFARQGACRWELFLVALRQFTPFTVWLQALFAEPVVWQRQERAIQPQDFANLKPNNKPRIKLWKPSAFLNVWLKLLRDCCRVLVVSPSEAEAFIDLRAKTFKKRHSRTTKNFYISLVLMDVWSRSNWNRIVME